MNEYEHISEELMFWKRIWKKIVLIVLCVVLIVAVGAKIVTYTLEQGVLRKVENNDFTKFSYVAFDSSQVTMPEVVEHERVIYGCENYEEFTGQVGTTLYFESKSNKLRNYLFQDGLLKEYTVYIHDEAIYNQVIDELNALYGPSDDDVLCIWNGNIDGHPAKIFSGISSSVLDKDFSAWVCISYSKQ